MDTKVPFLIFRAVTKDSWRDFETLLESRGGPKSCWCMIWRVTAEESKHTDGKSRKAFMHQRVSQGTPVGILGYLYGQPVAWCSIAPKKGYRNLTDKHPTETENVWSLVCYYVKREHRSKGFFKQMTKAAISYAQENGAVAIEAYPVEPNSPSYRFMGFVQTFEEIGFKEIGRAGSRRHIMTLNVE